MTKPKPDMSGIRKGPILSTEQVVEIYKIKLAMRSKNNDLSEKWRKRSNSNLVSRRYQVSPKAIRDIWNHITWKKITSPFWLVENKDVFCEKDEFVHRVDFSLEVLHHLQIRFLGLHRI